MLVQPENLPLAGCAVQQAATTHKTVRPNVDNSRVVHIRHLCPRDPARIANAGAVCAADLPFRGTQAVLGGAMTPHQLRRDCVRLHRDVYVRKGARPSARSRALAASLWSEGSGTLSGLSAAAWHGTKWIDSNRPAELIRANHVRAPKGIVVRAESLAPDEVCVVEGRSVTTPARTAFDLGRRLPLDTAIEVIDALCNATGLTPAEVLVVAERHPRARGMVQLRRVLALVDGGAESLQETRTRLLLVRDGLPIPTTQIRVVDARGRFIARADLGWTEWKVIVEYDGEQHWTDPVQRSRDRPDRGTGSTGLADCPSEQ